MADTNLSSFVSILSQAAGEILSATDLKGVCDSLKAHLVSLAGVGRVQVQLVDTARKHITLEYDHGHVVGLLDTNYKAWNNGYGGAAYRTRQLVLVNVGNFSHPGEATHLAENAMRLTDHSGNSLVFAPMIAGGRPIGTVVCSSKVEAHSFSPEDVDLITALVSLAATAIENVQLRQYEHERRRVAESLLQAGRKLSGASKLDEVPGRILAQLSVVVPYERGSLMLQEGETLRIVAQQGFPADQRVKELRISIREGDVYQQVAAAGRPVIIEDVTQISGWQQVPWLPLNRSWMGVPLFSKDQIIGMISLTRRDAGAFTMDDGLLVSTFALQAAIALENAGLYEEITRFNEQLERMVEQRTQELNQALHNLERLDRKKSDFINVAAHELRTPLTVMKGYTSMLEADPIIKSKPYLAESVRGMLSGTDRMHEIVNSMLDVARIENQTLEPHPELVSIALLVKRVQADLEEDLANRKLTLEIRDLQSLPKLHADPTLLLKVFQNVIFNAVKYTPDGGKITIAGRRVHDAEVGDCVEIQIKDTGIGIDPEQCELIFEKFYQTGKLQFHSSGKTSFKGGGPGLGLAIARGVVQAHGGRIWVESPGQDEQKCPGSTFFILLPISSLP